MADGAAAHNRSMIEQWLTVQGSDNTRAAYRADLVVFGDWCTHRGIMPLAADTATVIAFQSARTSNGDSSVTVRRRMSALSSFYDFAVERSIVAVNPADGVNRPKVSADQPRPTATLSAEAIAEYHEAAAAIDTRLEALVGLLVRDGLKVADALALDIADVKGRPPTMTVTIWRRSTSQRTVLDPATAQALRRCIGPRRIGPVFVSERSALAGNPTRLTRFGADHLIRQLRTGPSAVPVTANALRRFHLSTR